MSDAPMWEPRPQTKVDAHGICLMHGGPVGMRLAEHEHAEVQVEAHFTNGIAVKGGRLLDEEPSFLRVVPCGQPHSGRWENHCEVVVLLLARALFEEAADELLNRSHCEVVGTLYGSDALIHSLSRVLRQRFKNGVADDLLFVESAALKIVEQLVRRFSVRSGERALRGRLMPWQLRLTLDLIESRLGERISVAELAKLSGIGPHQFTQHFRAATDMSLYQFIVRRRIERAKNYLTNTDLNLAQIAHRLDFVSQSHFTEVFRRIAGTTPRRFRLLKNETRSVPADYLPGGDRVGWSR